MGAIWNGIIFNPIFNMLVVLYKITGNLGISIVLFTTLVRVLLIPIMAPAMKIRQIQKDIKPELDKLKKKYKDDKVKLSEKQMALMKEHGVNPASGCITPIVMIIFMIAVYKAVSMFTNGATIDDINSRIYLESWSFPQETVIDKTFLYLDLSKPDPYFVITIIAVVLQFLAGKMMLPHAEEEEKKAEKTPSEMDDVMASVQKQNIYMTPILFLVFGITMPSGVMLYIIISTLFQLIQTYQYTGWGGLTPWIKKIKFGNVRS